MNADANCYAVELFTRSRYVLVQSGSFRCGPFVIKSAFDFLKL